MSEQDKLIDEMEYYQDELKGQGDSESSLNDLLPCPFCGGPAEMWNAFSNPKRPAWIACMGRCAVLVTDEHKTTEEAIKTWNTRARMKNDKLLDRLDKNRAIYFFHWLAAHMVKTSGYNFERTSVKELICKYDEQTVTHITNATP